MFSARLYIRILLQVVAIVLVAGLGVAGIVTGRAVILGFVALFIAAWLISLLVYYLNASNRRIQLFLDAIEDDESMLYFPEDIGSREQRRLHAAFNRIHMLMTENRRKAFDRELHRKEYESWDKLMHVLTHEIMNSIAPVVPSPARSFLISGRKTRRKAAGRSPMPPSARRYEDWTPSKARGKP